MDRQPTWKQKAQTGWQMANGHGETKHHDARDAYLDDFTEKRMGFVALDLDFVLIRDGISRTGAGAQNLTPSKTPTVAQDSVAQRGHHDVVRPSEEWF
ncbi:hypothetical protein HYALB_00003480 [Hymenoscyphus albidus]|uniref:Uncharacterized protein n=1 Tax=Hymenoscyphus albidus TaxID=595503 RepID=A0A9N9LR22_9HELO|nr:hypothetical protein HYALB_00003480 [Hymenoscyphus albidus]